MRKQFVSLIAILVLAVSAFARDLPVARHVADIGSAFEFTLPTSAPASIVTAPVAWLSASDLRTCSIDQFVLSVNTTGQRAIDRDTYATKVRHVIGNRPRAVMRVWRC